MVKRRPPPQWHLLLTALLLIAAVAAVLVLNWQSQNADHPPVLPPLPSPARADVTSFGDSLYAQVDTALAELGIWSELISKRRRTAERPASPRRRAAVGAGGAAGTASATSPVAAATTRSTDAPGTPAAEDPTLDRISVRVPADLPLAVVNLSLTRLAQWHGGSVFRAAELRRTVEMVCGIDSVRTTLFALRSDRGLRRRVGEIAIVLYASDLSSWNQRLLRRFTSLSQPLTLSVLPDADHLDDIVALARRHGHELMLHLPMEPEDYPARDPGEGTLLVEHDDETISRLLRDHLRRLPAAVGVSNYMGSRATADSRVMGEVLRTLKKRRLFFLDSRTTPLSLGLLMATELEVPAAARDVVLDGGEGATPAAVEERLWELADLATRRGYAIGVADDSEQTLRALESMLPRLESRGYRFVRVSQLAR